MRKCLLWLCTVVFYTVFAGPTESAAQSTHLVISQVYAGAGCSTAGCSSYQNDFVEIFNPTNLPVNLNGWAIQCASSSGAQWQVTPLTNFSLQPGQYYLVSQFFSANGVNPLPAPDATGSFNLSESGGRVVLTNSTVALTGSCPSTSQIVDLMGYGSANCSESSSAPAPGPTTSLTRKSGGCKDTDNNSNDFDLLAPAPRNINTAVNICPVITISINDVSLTEGNSGTTLFNFTVSLSSPAPDGGVSFSIATANNTATVLNNDYVAKSLVSQSIPVGSNTYTFTVTVNGDAVIEGNESFFVNLSNVIGANILDGQGLGTILTDDYAGTSIATVQGNGNSSPLVNQVVQVQGIVTGIKSNGFFIQTPDDRVDSDPATSEGIFVFTSSFPTTTRGNEVVVTGTVAEFLPINDPGSQPLTEIVGPTITLISTGNTLPTPIVLSSTDLLVNSVSNIERFEGMRVQVNSLTCTAPSSGTINDILGTGVISGYFYGVITGTARPFREAGAHVSDVLPAGSPANVPRWDGNPEILGIDSKAQSGSTALDVSTGAVITSLIGPLDYTKRYYTIDTDPGLLPGITNNSPVFTPARAATTGECSMASINMQRFFDSTSVSNDPAVTGTAFNNRLKKASLAIRNVLNYPDVIAVSEVENLSTLQAIATKVNADAIAASQPDPLYLAYLVEGNDNTGLDLGYLVKSSKITTLSVSQIGNGTNFTFPDNGLSYPLFDMPPLVLFASISKPGCTPISFTIVNNHLLSLNNITDPTTGSFVRAKRKAQSEFLANYLQSRQTTDPTEKIICLGDFSAYSLNDGYVDVMGTIKGSPAASNQVVAASADLVNPDLINLTDSISASERYSYLSTGSAHAQDHVLITQSIATQVAGYSIARLGADFSLSLFSDNTRPERLTDHDVPVAYFNFQCSGPSAPTDYFRTRASGNWNSVATWESSTDGINWHAATLTPDFNANTITIMGGHSVLVTANVTVDQVVIKTSASLTVNTAVMFTIL